MNETNHPSSLATCALIQDFLGVKEGGIYEAVVRLKQRLDAVVAECARVKLIAKDLASEAAQTAGEYDDLCAEIDAETPSVTAALAEVGAKAIEKFIAKKLKQLEAMHPDTHAFGATAMEIRSQINELQAYVVELREGRV